MMPKNILIFADGTGNEGGLFVDEVQTNVYKLFRATRIGLDSDIDPAKQIAFYIPGIATPSVRHDSVWDRSKETIRQMFGLGLAEKIIDCYVAIVSVFQPGDRIFLFGFSRGAYTVRCLSHVLERCGIPTREKAGSAVSLDPKALRKLASKAVRCVYTLGMPISNPAKVDKNVALFCKEHAPYLGCEMGACPYLIGIWDAVAAIGWQRFFPDWAYDRHFAKDARYARHLQSIDEGRKDFKRVPWGGSGTVLQPPRQNEPEQFAQIWFAGNHADVGGGYPENESRLSDITLKWMVDFLTKEIASEARVAVDAELLKLHPSSAGMMHDECMVGIGGTDLKWSRAVREVPTDAVLHETVYERLQFPAVRNFASYGPYRPAALKNHERAKNYYG
jgi:uncharacterized protein (DUF2235 family)